MLTDRTVHARCGEREIVRYDRAGKWWVEYNPPRLRAARQVTIATAVQLTIQDSNDGNVEIFFGKPGGKSFDAKVKRELLRPSCIERNGG